jgi:hypothetical protein
MRRSSSDGKSPNPLPSTSHADANLLFCRAPFIQNTEQHATYFILFSMAVAILNYLRYAKSVIWQM